MGIGAALAGGSVLSGLLGAGSSIISGNQQAGAANNASAAQMAMFQMIQKNLAPFLKGGTGAFNQLANLTGSGAGGNPLTAPLTKPFNPTMQDLAATPGYQFTLNQGELAVQNGFASQGQGGVTNQPGSALGTGNILSGPAAKGAINYAEGLAANTYQSQFTNYLNQNQQIYNMLGGVAGTGENAAAQVGNAGLQAQSTASGYSTAAAAAGAAGLVGASNALGGAASNAGMFWALNNAGMFGSNNALGGGGGGGGVG